MGGGWKPPVRSASSSAKVMAVSSSYSGPRICMPTGRLPGVRPTGAAAAGGGGDRARVKGAGIMGERRGEVRRAHKDVVGFEVVRPGGAGRHPPVLLLDHGRKQREVLIGLLEGEEQPDLEPERRAALARGDAVGPALGDGHA